MKYILTENIEINVWELLIKLHVNFNAVISWCIESHLNSKLKEKLSVFKLKAIRRLTKDDEQFIKQLSDILNKVFYKGSELDQMMEKLNDFRKLAAKEDNIFKGSEGNKGYNLLDN